MREPVVSQGTRARDVRVRLIGVGNPFRGDDAAGRIVAQRFRERGPRNVAIVESEGEGVRLMELWRDVESVILVDAIQSGSEPGTVLCFDANRESLPGSMFRYSSHAFSVAEAVEMARVLGTLPKSLLIYGIEGENFSTGAALTPAVNLSVEALVDELTDRIPRM